MNGAHRSTTPRPLISGLKSAAWLLTVAALVALPLGWLALLAFAIYIPIAHPADLGPLAIAVQGATWVAVLGRLTWVLVHKRPGSPGKRARVTNEASLLLCITIGLFVYGGDQLGWWTRGPVGYSIAGVGLVLLLAIAAYWVLAERRQRVVREDAPPEY